MNIISANKKTHDFIFQNYPVNLNKMFAGELTEESLEQNLPYGKSFMKQWNFEGIRILHTRHSFHSNYIFKNNNEGEVVGLEFNIKGRYKIFHHGQMYQVQDQQHNVIYTPGIHSYFENSDLETETFKIEFNPELFRSITSDSNDILYRFVLQMDLKQPVVLSLSSGIIDLQLLNAINEIVNCRFSGGIKKTFLLSKCLEILVLQAESFAHTENPSYVYARRRDDLEKLEYVRKYLIEHMDMPPSLRELALKSGMNEYKLKRAFKEVYNTTVFGYLSGYRLNIAKQRLESNWQSIAEIAYDLGYSSPQHFSRAFKERFGLPPKSVRKV